MLQMQKLRFQIIDPHRGWNLFLLVPRPMTSFFFFFLTFIYYWKTESEREQGKSREMERHRICSRLQALSHQHRARCRAQTHKLQDHDLRCFFFFPWLISLPATLSGGPAISTSRSQKLSPGRGPCPGGSAEVKSTRHISIHQAGQASLPVNEVVSHVCTEQDWGLSLCLPFKLSGWVWAAWDPRFLDVGRRPGTQVNSLLTQVEQTADRDHLSFSLCDQHAVLAPRNTGQQLHELPFCL